MGDDHADALRVILGDLGDNVAAGFSGSNDYGSNEAILGLLTHGAVLPVVTQLLDSTNIGITHAVLYGNSASANLDRVVAGGKALAAIDRDLEMRPAPMITVDCIFNLRRDTEAICWCSPGSHLDSGANDQLVVPVHISPGGCAIFHRRILRNRQNSGVVALGFGPRWLQPASPLCVERTLELASCSCPVLRQMLGWHSSCGARWMGLNDNLHDIPLLAWLVHHNLAPCEGAASPKPGWPLHIDAGSGFPGCIEGDDGHSSAPRELNRVAASL